MGRGIYPHHRGIKACNVKLNEKQVLEIRELANQGRTERVIAAKFKMSKTGIHDIISRRNWSHL